MSKIGLPKINRSFDPPDIHYSSDWMGEPSMDGYFLTVEEAEIILESMVMVNDHPDNECVLAEAIEIMTGEKD